MFIIVNYCVVHNTDKSERVRPHPQLAVYVRWKTGLLVSADWLRPVTRGAWRAVRLNRGRDPDPIRGPVGTS